MEDDVQLIHRILSGDNEAFTALVRKHQKGVHALVWRRVGDFHLAEEITQDTFLQVYQKLPTLKDPRRFAGWLYVVANRFCGQWIRKNKSTVIRSLETIAMDELDRSSYAHHVLEQREEELTEQRHELVKRLLARLPESERTVVTLYYLGEMTTKEIGKFLGVSVNTITSQLQRARKRLQQDEELLVQEMLGSVPLSANLAESITRKVIDIKPTPSPTGKPLIPWASFSVTAVLIVLLLGVSNEYLVRSQQSYSLEATSEIKIDFVETSVKPIINVKPAPRTQLGRRDTSGENSRSNPQTAALQVAGMQTQETGVPIEETRRIQTEVLDFFRTPERGRQDYTVVSIDATAFEDGGTLTIDILVGSGKAAGSFDLFSGDSGLPVEGTPTNALVSEWGIQPGGTGTVFYRFDRGQVFQLGATGDWFSEKGSVNAFHALISIR